MVGQSFSLPVILEEANYFGTTKMVHSQSAQGIVGLMSMM